uniref:THAP-type domain-containing protein n=1 Tax=Ixodes ricinus TaxID=34613 RepID=V5IIX4_IXORI
MPAHCVAYGCTNYFYGKGNAKFFRFPSARLYPAKREAWIAAARRRNTDGSPWQPNEHCRICSAHFVTGRPSTFQNHPDFVPTIFSRTKTPGEAAAGDLRSSCIDLLERPTPSATSTSDAVLDRHKRLDDNRHRGTGARNSLQEQPEGFPSRHEHRPSHCCSRML